MLKREDFIGYVGDPDIHDGSILNVNMESEQVTVAIKAYAGHTITIRFSGVESVVQKDAKGMLLYALAEFKAVAPLRRFVFANWYEEDQSSASLEIICREISMAD